jgi:hypothetical protein
MGNGKWEMGNGKWEMGNQLCKDDEVHLKRNCSDKTFRFGVDCVEVNPKVYVCTSSGELRRKMRRS